MSKRKKKKAIHATCDFRGRVFHWPYCLTCGLVALKNESTENRIRKCKAQGGE